MKKLCTVVLSIMLYGISCNADTPNYATPFKPAQPNHGDLHQTFIGRRSPTPPDSPKQSGPVFIEEDSSTKHNPTVHYGPIDLKTFPKSDAAVTIVFLNTSDTFIYARIRLYNPATKKSMKFVPNLRAIQMVNKESFTIPPHTALAFNQKDFNSAYRLRIGIWQQEPTEDLDRNGNPIKTSAINNQTRLLAGDYTIQENNYSSITIPITNTDIKIGKIKTHTPVLSQGTNFDTSIKINEQELKKTPGIYMVHTATLPSL